MDESVREASVHSQTAVAVDMIMKTAMTRKTSDNITCLLIAFQNFEDQFVKTKKDVSSFDYPVIQKKRSLFQHKPRSLLKEKILLDRKMSSYK
jgi:hypothetical protein